MINTLKKTEQTFFKELGERIRKLILEENGYKSLDSFALEHHEMISKPTLYAICDGERDFQFSTIIRLAEVLNMSVDELIEGLHQG